MPRLLHPILAAAALAVGCAEKPEDTAGSADTGPWALPDDWTCGDDVVDARDGNTYRSIALGDQCWLRDNLGLGTMIESTAPGSLARDDGVVEKYCWDDDPGWCDGTAGRRPGGFYEWTEVLQDWSGDQPVQAARGICPAGFHVPSSAEWGVLVERYGGTCNRGQELLVGGSTGFDALLTGYRCTLTGGFRPAMMSTDFRAYFWTSDTTTPGEAWLWEVSASPVLHFDFDLSLGLSVRCIGDAPA